MDKECFLTSSGQLRRRRRRRWQRWALLATLPALTLAGAGWEMHGSALQAWFFARLAGHAGWQMAAGEAATIWLPNSGPYDIRLGHSRLREMLPRLAAAGYTISEQARQSPGFVELTQRGFYPVYREKSQAGLTLLDRREQALYRRSYPARQYADFDEIPPLLVDTLLYIENRGLLDETAPSQNPAVDWGRLGQASLGQARRALNLDAARAGGSTLATQIEKFRHTPEGRTRNADDKWRQMVSASLRAYQDGKDTLAARRRIVLDFLNSVPLGGLPGHGEINGLGDGLQAWYGRDLDELGRLLATDADPGQRAQAFKEALSLIIAQRRPSELLAQNPARLGELTDSHLRLLGRDGVIDGDLLARALPLVIVPKTRGEGGERIDFARRKAINDARLHLGKLVGESDFHTLDRLDLEAYGTLDGAAQAAVSDYLARLADGDYLRCAGFVAPRLLARGNPAAVRYAFTLYERSELGNLLRVHADNLDQPLDINAGTRLDLGSSAKLRTLVSYLAAIAELHGRYAGKSPAELAAIRTGAGDRLTRWAIDHLAGSGDRELTTMLGAALARRYPADPGETFFTGGGLHRFQNFKREDDATVPSVAEALEQSINLPFVRLMRDLVHYHAYEAPDAPARALRDGDETARRDFLERFAEREGRIYLRRFWHEYRDLTDDERRRRLADGAGNSPRRLAAAYFGSGAGDAADFADFAAFVRSRPGAAAGDDAALRRLHASHAGKTFSLADWAYLARLHPLELWLAGHLRRHPAATWEETLAASSDERVAASEWLFRSRYREAQNRRLAIIVEVAAFERLAAEWRRFGYPFDELSPSLASAIGSAADRPAALAELVGILLDDGRRRPLVRISELRFATATPFETRLRLAANAGERVLPAAVAAAARQAMQRVVDNGTARRLRGIYRDADGTPLVVGGKTGTGDHRHHVVDGSGQSVSSRVVNRAATFAFFIGERFHGVATAYVGGADAAAYDFTSALPVQIVREIEPLLRPLVTGAGAGVPSCLQTTKAATGR